MMDSFSPTFKWVVPRNSGPKTWSCEIEASHMAKIISYRQRWEKHCFLHCELSSNKAWCLRADCEVLIHDNEAGVK